MRVVWGGSVQVGDSSRHLGFFASLALHAGLITVVVLQPTPPPGTASDSRPGIVVVDLVALPSSAPAGASVASGDAGLDRQARPLGAQVEAKAEPDESQRTRGVLAHSGGDPLTMAEPGESQADGVGASRLSSADGAVRSNYQSALFAHVMRYRYYPEDARSDRLRGVVRVQFALSRSGRIMAAWVVTSSGYPMLDEAALDALSRAQPLPPIPPELPDEMEVLLPLDYVPPKVILAWR
jgi:periplasmic protein TonB